MAQHGSTPAGRFGEGMQIVIVTRHIARAATFYSPILKALQEDGTHVTLVGPAGTDAHIAERRGLRTREVALRPFGGRPVALEWAVLAGDLLKMGQDAEGGQTPLDVLMSFEEDLAPVVSRSEERRVGKESGWGGVRE